MCGRDTFFHHRARRATTNLSRVTFVSLLALDHGEATSRSEIAIPLVPGYLANRAQ
jgi:hypothetical protein